MAIDGASSIAACFAGWLHVNMLPRTKSLVRQNFVDVIGADVFVAGTFSSIPHSPKFHMPDCSAGQSTRGGRNSTSCLLARLTHLLPITRWRLDSMLTHQQLLERVQTSPHWTNISASFAGTRRGLTIWAPLLGNPRLSVLREQHDLSRVLDLVVEHERSRGYRYERVVWSRLEYDWLAPHPPMSVLPDRTIWVPPDASLSDRHAVMDRRMADAYFRRWELLLSAQLVDIIPRETLLRGTSERLLQALLRHRGIRIRTFPSTMVINCCLPSGRCWMPWSCWTGHNVLTKAHVGGPTIVRTVRAKYADELNLAVAHAAVLASGARFVTSTASHRSQANAAGTYEVGVVLQIPLSFADIIAKALNHSFPLQSPWIKWMAAVS